MQPYDQEHDHAGCKHCTYGSSEWCNTEEAAEELTTELGEAAYTIFWNQIVQPRHAFLEWLYRLPKTREEAELLDRLES